MNNKLKPAILGGLVVGILSAIGSLIPFIGSFCCCLFSIAGGALAAFLYIKSSPTPVAIGDGAIVGGMAGVVGGVLYFIIALPLALLWGAAAMSEAFNRSGAQMPLSGPILMVVASFIGAVILALLATLGGVIGVAIFEKRKNGAAPPQPPSTGGSPNYGSSI